jgi:hypothetical protein
MKILGRGAYTKHEFKRSFPKTGRYKALETILERWRFFTAVGQFLLLGKSRTALEILLKRKLCLRIRLM